MPRTLTGEIQAPRARSRSIAGTSAAFTLVAILSGCGAAATPSAPAPAAATVEATARPAPAPARWTEVTGLYVAGGDTVLVYERDMRLHLRLGGVSYPLTEEGPDRYRFPGWGRYAAGSVEFTRGEGHTVRGVVAAGGAFAAAATGAPDATPFRIRPLRPVEQLRREARAASPPRGSGERAADLVDLARLDPTIRLDIRYATTNNFMGAIFYPEPRAFLQRPAAEALLRAHHRLRTQGYGLLVHDAYRPWHVTRMFWDATPGELRDFVAEPTRGSRHNRGAAVDLSLYDLRSGEALEMPSGYDEFSPRAYPDFSGGTSRQRWARELLREVMEAEGFRVYELEWWHFDHHDWQRYPILDLAFDEIQPSTR